MTGLPAALMRLLADCRAARWHAAVLDACEALLGCRDESSDNAANAFVAAGGVGVLASLLATSRDRLARARAAVALANIHDSNDGAHVAAIEAAGYKMDDLEAMYV